MTNQAPPLLTERIEKPPYRDWPKRQKEHALRIFDEFMTMNTDCTKRLISDLSNIIAFIRSNKRSK